MCVSQVCDKFSNLLQMEFFSKSVTNFKFITNVFLQICDQMSVIHFKFPPIFLNLQTCFSPKKSLQSISNYYNMCTFSIVCDPFQISSNLLNLQTCFSPKKSLQSISNYYNVCTFLISSLVQQSINNDFYHTYGLSSYPNCTVVHSLVHSCILLFWLIPGSWAIRYYALY